jgi:hypothetical protein
MFLQTYSYGYISIFPVIAVFFSCTFNAVNNEPLTITCINQKSDSVSLWPQLIFTFSTKLKDSIVILEITPDPGPQYSTFLNEFKDTLFFKVTGVLNGNTTYSITFKDRITGENGKMLYPEDVSFTIITGRGENEPNNSISIADTVFDICYGTISPVNDTDYYYLSYQLSSNLYLKCHDRLTGFKIIDSSGSIINEQAGTQEIKQYSISNSAVTPFYICIFSLSDNNAKYELGITNQLRDENQRLIEKEHYK